MSFNVLEVLGAAVDIISNVSSGSSSMRVSGSSKKSKKEDKYFTEKVSAGFILASVVLFFVVFINLCQ